MELAEMKVLLELLQQRHLTEFNKKLEQLHPYDVARYLEELDSKDEVLLFRRLPKSYAADCFSYMEAEARHDLIVLLTDPELEGMVEELFLDDMVDVLDELPANVVKRILKLTPPERRALVNRFLEYPEDSAGSIMTAEFTDLKAEMRVSEAIERIRRIGEDRETIYTCYVVDSSRVLEGVISVKDLLRASDNDHIADLMITDIIKVNTDTDREEAAHLIRHYDLMALPVVDKEQRLVGIITVDDAVDVMQEENTEDIQLMAGVTPSEDNYADTPVWILAKNRIPWLMVLMFTGIVSGAMITHYDHALAALPILISFIPMLTDTGGNAGSQSSTLVIRSLALQELRPQDFWRVLRKEFGVGLICGLVLGLLNFARLLLVNRCSLLQALTVSLAVLFTVLLAKIIGGALPLMAKFCKMDPAIMCSPLITTLVDIGTLFVYFELAKILLFR